MTVRIMDCSLWLLLVVSAVASSSDASWGENPVFNITALTLYDAGLQHGRLASSRIQAWLASAEIDTLWNFTRNKGMVAYERLRRDSSQAFPQYADELHGIAAGANVSLDRLWAAMLMIELENLMGLQTAEHCSDISAIATEGYKAGFAHGHNEDWSPAVGKLYYYVKYTAALGADFASCAGFAYPGALIGWAATWNSQGVFMTVNTLSPRRILPYGVATAFIQREAMCGLGRGDGLDQVISGLTVGTWSDGASINLVDLRSRRMANIETYEGRHNTLEITEELGNYSHFNRYKRLGPGVTDWPQPSSLHRQARADSLPPPRTRNDIAAILSDSQDNEYPIFRNITIATLLLDGITGRLDVWCCGRSVYGGHPPVHTWNVFQFFASPSVEPVIV